MMASTSTDMGRPFTYSGPHQSQIYVPVLADGALLRDSAGDVIATFVSPRIAAAVAVLINRDAFGHG